MLKLSPVLVSIPLACLVATGLTAQKFLYSPPSAATAYVTTGGNTIPLGASGAFGTQARYQQVHTDLAGSAVLIDAIAMRRSGRSSAWTGTINTAGTIDVAVVMAYSDHSKLSATFSANYAATPTVVMKRAKVSIPNTQAVPSGLAPWNIAFPFTSTFVYDGKRDLVWELQMYSVLSQSYFIDAASRAVSGSNLSFGTGCTATGQTNKMLQQFFVTQKPWSNTVEYWGRIFYGPVTANAGIALGVQRTAQTVGWCTQVYTNPIQFWFGKTGTGNGVFAIPTVKAPWKSSYANTTFITQGFAVDSNQPGSLALTQGLQTTVGPMPKSTGVASRIFTSGGSPTSVSGFLGEGYAIAIRFQHK